MQEGLEFKIARIRAGVRQYVLAAKIGLRPAVLSEIESGRRPINRQTAHDLKTALDEIRQASNETEDPR